MVISASINDKFDRPVRPVKIHFTNETVDAILDDVTTHFSTLLSPYEVQCDYEEEMPLFPIDAFLHHLRYIFWVLSGELKTSFE